jgi:hypothetical protein
VLQSFHKQGCNESAVFVDPPPNTGEAHVCRYGAQAIHMVADFLIATGFRSANFERSGKASVHPFTDIPVAAGAP